MAAGPAVTWRQLAYFGLCCSIVLASKAYPDPRPSAPNPKPGHWRPQDQQCYVDEETGEVVVQYHATDIVRVNVSGDVKITSGGYHTVSGW